MDRVQLLSFPTWRCGKDPNRHLLSGVPRGAVSTRSDRVSGGANREEIPDSASSLNACIARSFFCWTEDSAWSCLAASSASRDMKPNMLSERTSLTNILDDGFSTFTRGLIGVSASRWEYKREAATNGVDKRSFFGDEFCGRCWIRMLINAWPTASTN